MPASIVRYTRTQGGGDYVQRFSCVVCDFTTPDVDLFIEEQLPIPNLYLGRKDKKSHTKLGCTEKWPAAVVRALPKLTEY